MPINQPYKNFTKNAKKNFDVKNKQANPKTSAKVANFGIKGRSHKK